MVNECFEGLIREDLSLGDTTPLRQCLERSINITDEISEALADLEYFKAQGTLRRRAVFIDRHRKA